MRSGNRFRRLMTSLRGSCNAPDHADADGPALRRQRGDGGLGPLAQVPARAVRGQERQLIDEQRR